MPTLTSTANLTDVPARGTWEIDPSHSRVEFSVRHLGLSKVRGRFGVFSGRLHVADEAEESSVEVSIDAASIDTRAEDRDAHLRGPDFLDTEAFPTVEFHSTSIAPRGSDRWDVAGELTIRGATRPVVLEADLEGVAVDPWGNTRGGLSGRTRIDREDFGLTWNQVLETGGVLVGKAVDIEVEVEVVRQEES